MQSETAGLSESIKGVGKLRVPFLVMLEPCEFPPTGIEIPRHTECAYTFGFPHPAISRYDANPPMPWAYSFKTLPKCSVYLAVFLMKNEGNSVFKKPMDFFYTKGKKLNSLGSQLHRITVNRSKGKTTSFLTDLAERCP